MNPSYENLSTKLLIFFYQMAVMEEVHKQMGEIASKQNDKISELNAEIRKLKAMIVKHESRIRFVMSQLLDLKSVY